MGAETPKKARSTEMETEMNFGNLNNHAVGIIMKELVRRAIDAIRSQQFAFDMKEKSTVGKEIDFVTSADQAAQTVYLKSLRECTPDFGIIAEENNFRTACQLRDRKIYWSVDPMDGTKAFIRRQSHGIGTMLAMAVDNGRAVFDNGVVNEVIAAFVGDVMTQEIYGFRPGSKKVYRISEYNHAIPLEIDPERLLFEQIVLLRDYPENFSLFMKEVVQPRKFFKGIEIGGGSIGISFARLWKGEVGGIILNPSHDTPWDLWPVIGISQKLGFVFLKPSNILDDTQTRLWRYVPEVSLEIKERDHYILVVHQSRMKELGAFG